MSLLNTMNFENVACCIHGSYSFLCSFALGLVGAKLIPCIKLDIVFNNCPATIDLIHCEM